MSPEKRVNIIADSTANLPQEIIDRYNLGIVHLSVNVLKNKKVIETFMDDINIDRPAFVKKLEDKKLDIKTASPSIGEFINLYERFTGKDILFIHLASGLSGGTVEAAKTAARNYDYNNVVTYDSGSVTVITAGQVIKASKLAEEGKTIKEIITELDDYKKRSVLLVAVKGIGHLKKSGRVNGLKALFAAATGIVPILEVRNSLVEEYGRGKNIDEALELIERISLGLNPEEICVAHGGDEEYEEKAGRIIENIRKTNEKIKIERSAYAGPCLTSHIGSRVIAIGVVSKEPIPEKIIFKSK